MATEVDKVNNGFLATLVAVGTFAMVGISLALVALVRDELALETSAKDAAQDAEYQAVRKSQIAKLQGGTPIEAAIANVVRDVAADPEKATPPARPGAAGPSSQGTAGAGSGGAGTAGAGTAGAGTAGVGGAAGSGAGGATGIAPASSGQSAKETEGGVKPNVQKDGKLTPAGGAPAPQPSGSAKGGRAPAAGPGGTSPPPQGASNTGSSSNPHGQ